MNQADRPRLDGSLSEQAFAALVDQLRQRGGACGPELVPLLSVSHEVFRGRFASSSVRMRAYAMAAVPGRPERHVDRSVLTDARGVDDAGRGRRRRPSDLDREP